MSRVDGGCGAGSGGVFGVLLGGMIFLARVARTSCTCPFPTASGYKDNSFSRPLAQFATHSDGPTSHRQKKKHKKNNFVLRLLAGHVRRPPHATNRPLFSNYLSIEIRTSFYPFPVSCLTFYVSNPLSDHPNPNPQE